MAFLDEKVTMIGDVTRADDDSGRTAVHGKATHTGSYLGINSNLSNEHRESEDRVLVRRERFVNGDSGRTAIFQNVSIKRHVGRLGIRPSEQHGQISPLVLLTCVRVRDAC